MTITLDQTLTRRIAGQTRRLREEIDERNAELRALAARTLALSAQSVDPAAEIVTVHCIDSWFAFDQITCTGTARQTTTLTGMPVDVLSVVSNALSSLQSGDAVAPWKRVDDTAQVNVPEALAQEAGFPFRTLAERILDALEEQTGKTIRRIEITSEEFDNGFYPSKTVEVDYTDGDGDEVYFDAFEDGDYLNELREYQGQFGRNTRIVITSTAPHTASRSTDHRARPAPGECGPCAKPAEPAPPPAYAPPVPCPLHPPVMPWEPRRALQHPHPAGRTLTTDQHQRRQQKPGDIHEQETHEHEPPQPDQPHRGRQQAGHHHPRRSAVVRQQSDPGSDPPLHHRVDRGNLRHHTAICRITHGTARATGDRVPIDRVVNIDVDRLHPVRTGYRQVIPEADPS